MSQHDSTTPPPPGTPGAPYGGPASGLAGRGTTFFTWMRGLGITRSDGWLGGVCAGVAHRIGIDPLIVRGIVVVAAILGAPMLLIYAAAWALLPDRENRIHLQRLFDGDFQPAIVGIGVLALLALLPWAPGIWWANGGFWGSPSLGDVIGRVIWTLIVLALIAGLIVWAVRGNWGRDAWGTNRAAGTGQNGSTFASSSAGSTSAAGPSTSTVPDGAASTASDAGAATGSGAAAGAPGPGVWMADATGASTQQERSTDTANATPSTTAAPDAADIVPLDPAASADPTVAKPTLDVTAEPSEPPAPTLGASSQDVADWRARHAAWQAEHAQWKARLDEDMRAVKRQRAAELRAQASVATAEAAAQRRAYRAANPRIGAAFGWATIGLALVTAAIVSAVWEPTTGLSGYGVTAAFAAATFVFGVAVLIAGLARRRSGFFIFLGILLAVVTLVSAWVPRDRQLVFDGAFLVPTSSSQYAQAYGDTTISVDDTVLSGRGTPVIDLVKGSGETHVNLVGDVTVKIVAVTDGTGVNVTGRDGNTIAHACTPGSDGRCTVSTVVGPSTTADAIVRVDQSSQVSVVSDTSAQQNSTTEDGR
ncbi:PspC domain-containing protein [Leifsonia sp. NPDC102414]|uniref:PspC domain-containing protein n=1 Tax=Leifsonia sp. NPDC102414 TaxID=3364124 RepID=UPI0037FD1BBA